MPQILELHALGVNSLTLIQGLHSTNPAVANMASAATSIMPPIVDAKMEDHSSNPSRSLSPSHDEDVVDDNDPPPPGCTWMVGKNSGNFYLWDTTTRTVVNLPTMTPLQAFSAQPSPQPAAYAAVVAAH
jgi:hypothetical protein